MARQKSVATRAPQSGARLITWVHQTTGKLPTAEHDRSHRVPGDARRRRCSSPLTAPTSLAPVDRTGLAEVIRERTGPDLQRFVRLGLWGPQTPVPRKSCRTSSRRGYESASSSSWLDPPVFALNLGGAPTSLC